MQKENHNNTFIKLVTFWVIIEAFLGGIIHATRLPISGILVGGGSALCISLIGYYTKSNTNILAATLLVSICKMMLSPHSPLPAYIAVFFQGFIGFLFFGNIGFFKMRCILFTCVSFLESAIQRVLVTTFIYGKNFWTTLDQFIQELTHSNQPTQYSYILISIYIAAHLLCAVIIGWYIAHLPKKLNDFTPIPAMEIAGRNIFNLDKKSSTRSRFKWLFFILIISTLYYLSFMGIFHTKMSKQIIEILFRSMIIVSFWKFILGPISTKIVQAYLTKQKGKYRKQIELINSLMPSMQQTINHAWHLAKSQHISLLRMINYVILHTLHHIVRDE